jgi:hypothetical protein
MGVLTSLTEAVVRSAKGAIPELADRGTAAAPTILKTAMDAMKAPAQRAESIPFAGLPSSKAAVRATMAPRPGVMEAFRNGDVTPLVEGVQKLKRNFASVFRADPGVPQDVQIKMQNGRGRVMAASDNADLDLRDALHPIQTDPKAQATLLNDYMVEADNVATAYQQRQERLPDGRTAEEANTNLALLQGALERDPELKLAHENIRGVLNTVFDDMVHRGYIMPDRMRTDYTPRRMLTQVAEGLATYRGQDAGADKLGETFGRSSSIKGMRETNVLDLLRHHLGDYYRKVAEDEMLTGILDDQTLNLSQHFNQGDVIPPGLTAWTPGPGMPGYGIKTKEGHFLDGLMDGLNGDPTKYRGGYIVPSQLADALNTFHGQKMDALQKGIYGVGSAWARQMTVYNVANLTLNMISDLPVALMGEPGQPSRALGIIRFLPQAIREVTQGMTGHDSQIFDMARREGLTEMASTVSTADGRPQSMDFTRFDPDAQALGPVQTLKDSMRRMRQGVETVPRIAAGLEALSRTGSFKEFGRVGRVSTLPYGAGSPALTRYPGLRFLTPFITWLGLASDRVFKLAATKGSQGRLLMGMAAVPTATMMWNYQNDDFQKVENALPDFERNQTHIIVPSPSDPSKPHKDKFGKPVVLRFRYWVPEEIARTYGMGNLPSRIRRVAAGRSTFGQELGRVPKDIMSGVTSQIGAVGALIALGDSKNKFTGQEEPFSQKLWNLLPVARTAHEVYRGAVNAGPTEAVKRGVEELSGARFAAVTRKGRNAFDADLAEAQRHITDAKMQYRSALVKGDREKAQVARARMMSAVKDLQRVSKARAKEGK